MAKPKILQQLNAEASSQILLKEDPDVAMEAATKQYVDNSGGTFYAVYGTTTHAEILTAYNQGKTIVAVNNTYIGYLRTPPKEGEPISFMTMPTAINYSSEYRYWWYVSTSNAWSSYRGDPGGYTFNDPIRLFNSTPINTSSFYRPINVSLNAPTASDGKTGDIWVVYNNE